jgi:acyl transferase domain-containing protein/3-hydroxymyristoyl/3-hydroxydecanoyl-(acyl carrier protein) dehydratase
MSLAMSSTEPIAIVSFAGRFPGAAADLDCFWGNIAAAADCATEVPKGRWVLPPEQCRDPRIANSDTVYSTRGYFLDPFVPDLDGLDIDPSLVAELDPLFRLVLDVGNRAWKRARTERIDRTRAGVVLGNICLPTDKSSDLCRAILGSKLGLSAPPTNPLNRYVAGLPAGMLAKGLRLGGGSYTLDAACASSLFAIKLAADELAGGRADVMLAGGCSRPDCQYTQMGFAQLRALSPSGRCSPFDGAADGLMVGEGAGVFVLKRLRDALAQDDAVHAVITGVGLSNDMHGNLLAPAKEGQLRAMRSAYARAGWDPSAVDFIECHATGTPVGDAVEFGSLRELWGETGWVSGQCAIGSVKSTVGHLLTGAGAAAVEKVLLAMKAEVLPPQANFARPADGLAYADGPFRVLQRPEPWSPRNGTRRAAVSGFGFGGVNAHLLLEQYRAESGAPVGPYTSAGPALPIAIVGLAAEFGPWNDTRAFQEHLLNGIVPEPSPKANGWPLAHSTSPPALGIEELAIPIARFRIPPKELEETLPQQLLMLQVAASALADCHSNSDLAADAPTTGAFIGLGLDPNTTNFHLRWSRIAAAADPDTAGPPLSANRTMGALGSIAASRVARAFHFGGPCHTVCNEEGSTARAIELGVRALQRGELDRVLVGGVDLACDPRTVLPGPVELPGEGAAAFVLKRLVDAERDGDRIHAVIRGVGAAASEDAALERAVADAAMDYDTAIWFDAGGDVGNCGAAGAGASLAKACLALRQGILPDNPPRFWLHDRAQGPRRAWITSTGADGTHLGILLEEHGSACDAAAGDPEREQPLGAREEAVFVVEAQSTGDLIAGLGRLRRFAADCAGGIERIARNWRRETPPASSRRLAVAVVARSVEELTEQVDFAASNLRRSPDRPFPASAKPALRDRVFFSPNPLGPDTKVAVVFPGSGNHFDGMGRGLSVQWPDVLRRQMEENELLRSQFAPDLFWDGVADDASPRELMFGQVAVGALVSDILASLGVQPSAMIGVSLGESAGLFGVRAWRDRDEMFHRMRSSSLFNTDLAPPFNAARTFWNLAAEEIIDWVSGVIAASDEAVRAALKPGLRAYLLIINTPGECVIGGERADVSRLAAAVGKPVTLLSGVTLAHCEAGASVEEPYRGLHTLPAVQPTGVTIYSGAWGKRYTATDRNCAYSITAGLLNTIDVPALIESAYRDGVRVFIEVGPGASCVRAIDAILGERPHLARAAHAAKQDAVSQILRLIAHLAAEHIPVDLGSLYDRETECAGHREPRSDAKDVVVIPVGRRPEAVQPVVGPARQLLGSPRPAKRLHPSSAKELQGAIEAAANVRTLTLQSHESFLRISDRFTRTAAGLVEFQNQLLATWAEHNDARGRTVERRPGALDHVTTTPAHSVPRELSYEQCCAFAVGRVGDVLGPLFAEIDRFPTRVRLPEGPLQLVDRMTLVEGEPLSLGPGRVVTEHTVRRDRWYLESDRIPTALSVESGQADLFLSGFLGIDLRTRGLAVYRLLDAVVSFHRELPRVGETVVYDIRIDEFTQQGESWIFRFRFDGTINGVPFITMRNGVAGFFTAEALTAGRGIVQTALDRKPMLGKRPADWRDLVPFRETSLSSEQVDALRGGDLARAFGADFANLPFGRPATIPGDMLRLVDRVPLIDPGGGRFGLGLVRAEFDIHPDDWFLKCHFIDDQVMPGTLMYECCLHTLRIFLLRMGWVGDAGEVHCEPVPGVSSRLKCRGQVIATTRTVTYEVSVKELGYRPEPYCLADALMYADGRPIVEITNMSLRICGLSREKVEEVWGHVGRRPALYDSASILAFSNGKPSDAFGPPYRVFDSERVIARLPGPPFQFLDRVVSVTGAPFVLKAGASCEAEYEVPSGGWYFEANRAALMPFAVLLEIALQPCGWLAAYCGSALLSPEDLSFRNLGGKATQLRAVTPATGTLTTTAAMTSVSHSAGMIIQHFDFRVRDSIGDVYGGSTYFGFFSKAQLSNQVGIREARVQWPTDAERARAERATLPYESPFPAPMLRMIDQIDSYLPDGGSRGLGLVVGRIAVDPSFWFFKSHFFQDPVWPGSLGVESFLQLLKFAAWKRWGEPRGNGWQTVALGHAHSWSYRGQVIPQDREVVVVLEVTAVDEDNRRLAAQGFLTVDGRVIYQMTDFTLE